ncbi:MAG: ribonuclease III [Limnochordaceae bacterium]|nr:ribonuclease III [Limnochordaceae bacterium]
MGHRFADPALLRRALTHRSVGAEHPAAAGQHNERLEFLGDAVVGLVVSAWLFREFPDWPEGELTRLRAQLVRGPTLASLARRYRIDERLLLGKGAQVQGAREHERVLAGAFEAVVGAIFVDGGWEAARSSLERCLPDALRLVRPPSQANPKGALQELLAKLNRPAPEYRVVEMEGPPHQRRFTVELRCPPDVTVRAQGHSRQAAEEAAARLVLERLRAGPSQVL